MVAIEKGKSRKERSKKKWSDDSLLSSLVKTFSLSSKKRWKQLLSVCFLLSGSILLIYSLRFPFFVSPSLGALTPTTNFSLPVYICFLTFVFYGFSFRSKHTLAWQTWSCILLFILLLSFCFPFLLPRSSSYTTENYFFRSFVRFYPDPWGGKTFQIQMGIWWFFAGTLLFTGGTFYNLFNACIRKIRKASKTHGILAFGILVQAVSFFMFYNNATYFGSVTYSFTLQHSQSWLAMLAFPLFIYAFCENNRRVQGYGLVFSSLFAFTGYILPYLYIPEIFPVAFSGVYVYTVSTCLLWTSLLLHIACKRKPLQQIIVDQSDTILSMYFFAVFLFNTASPWLDFGHSIRVLAKGLRYLFLPHLFLVILGIIAGSKGMILEDCTLKPYQNTLRNDLLPWLAMAFVSSFSMRTFFSITKGFPYFSIKLNSMPQLGEFLLIPVLFFLPMFIIEKIIVLLVCTLNMKIE